MKITEGASCAIWSSVGPAVMIPNLTRGLTDVTVKQVELLSAQVQDLQLSLKQYEVMSRPAHVDLASTALFSATRYSLTGRYHRGVSN